MLLMVELLATRKRTDGKRKMRLEKPVFLVDGQVSGLGTVHPFFTFSFFSTWILPFHVVSSLKRKSSSSVMDGFQREERDCSTVSTAILSSVESRSDSS